MGEGHTVFKISLIIILGAVVTILGAEGLYKHDMRGAPSANHSSARQLVLELHGDYDVDEVRGERDGSSARARGDLSKFEDLMGKLIPQSQDD